MSSQQPPTPTPPDGNAEASGSRQGRGNNPSYGRGGRGGYNRRNNGGRGHGRANRGPGGRNNQGNSFKGSTPELHGYTFGIYEGYTGAKQYTKNLVRLELYSRSHCKTDLGALFTGKSPTMPTVEKPMALTKEQKEDEIEVELHKLSLKEYSEETRKMKNDVKKMYAVVYGQCTEAMTNKLKALSCYEDMHEKADCARLLREICKINYHADEKEDPFMSTVNTLSRLYKLVQERESLTMYYETWVNLSEVVKHKGGGFVDEDLIKVVLRRLIRKMEDEKVLEEEDMKLRKKAKEKAEERYLASLFIKGLSGAKYGRLKAELSNQYSWGTTKYPVTVADAYEMALQYQNPDGNRRDREYDRNGRGMEGLSFQQNDGGDRQQAVAGTDGRTWYNMICYHCNQPGHRAALCPEAANTGARPSDGNTQANNAGGNTQGERGTAQQGVSHCIVSELTGEYGFSFTQLVKKKGTVNGDWLLLDSQSMHSIFSNPSLLTNIRHCGHTGLTMYSNGGAQHTVMVGDYAPLGIEVWYNPQSLANILSLRDVRKVCRVTMDTEAAPAMAVHSKGDDGKIMIFKECSIGLYRHNLNDPNNLNQLSAYSFINTVESNKEGFTNREIQKAKDALKLYRIIGRPSERRYYKILSGNQIINCPITVDDARRAFYIFGPDVATLRGKTTRQRPRQIKDFTPIKLPPEIRKKFLSINLAADIFYVQGQAHQHTISRRIKLRTAERLKCTINPKKEELLQSVMKVIRLYEGRGFTVNQIIADNQYACIRDDLLPHQLTTVAAGEHVGDVERSIRTMKEAARTMTQGLPFGRYPRLLVASIVKKAITDSNSYLAENGVSDDLSPRTIVTGLPKVDFNNCRLEIGEYCEVYATPDPTNTQHTRTVGAIALTPSNEHGGYHFMSLQNGDRLHGHQWRSLPMTTYVIRQVERLARREKQPPITKGGLRFAWGPDDPILDEYDDEDDYDEDYETDSDSDDDEDMNLHADDYDDDTPPDDLLAHQAGEDQRSDGNENEHDEHEHDEHDNEHDEHNNDEDDHDNDDAADFANEHDNNNNDYNAMVTDTEDHEEDQEDHVNEEDNETDNGDNNNESNRDTTDSNKNNERSAEERSAEPSSGDERSAGPPSGDERSAEPSEDERSAEDANKKNQKKATKVRRSNCATKNHDYKQVHQRGFSFMNTTDPTKVDKVKMAKNVTGLIFAQLEPENQQKRTYYWKAGVRAMGDDAVKAIVKEVKQLDNKETFKPVRKRELTAEQRYGALELITTVTKKRCGRVKGRTCANGHKQREYVSRAEASSPTVSLEGLMTIILTAAHKDRQVLVADIAGAYLNADMDDFVVMKFRDEMVDYMVAANPERYADYVEYENGKKVLYVRLLKALYGCIQSALLWYKLFTGKLMKMGYKLNSYDQCVANKMVKGRQCTVGYYVDDLIATHVDKSVLEELKNELDKEYGEMSATYGDEQTYLGMDIKFNRKTKQARISMKGYLQEGIEKFEEIEKLSGKPAHTPAKRDLFEVRESAEKLNEKRKIAFHSITALLLYVSKRARPDIQTTIAFLCTRPSVADVDDWRKLKRLLQYLRTTIELDLILGADSLQYFKTFIDVAYGVHADMKSHTGGSVTFGTGVLSSKSSKQKLNVKSSTEGEVIGMSDYVAFPIWFRYFLHKQGYDVKENVVYQDNQSAIKIEKNGINSCGQKSKHIKSRYFFIKDRVEQNEITIEYCPTERMLADFFTKPLQGKLFRRFRDVIMGYKHIDTLLNMPITKKPSKERVEQNGTTNMTGTSGKTTEHDDVGNGRRSYAEIVKGKGLNEHSEGRAKLIQLE